MSGRGVRPQYVPAGTQRLPVINPARRPHVSNASWGSFRFRRGRNLQEPQEAQGTWVRGFPREVGGDIVTRHLGSRPTRRFPNLADVRPDPTRRFRTSPTSNPTRRAVSRTSPTSNPTRRVVSKPRRRPIRPDARSPNLADVPIGAVAPVRPPATTENEPPVAPGGFVPRNRKGPQGA